MRVGLVIARAGSKGLPRKNVLELSGKPLINWTIEAALESDSLDQVFVSSEDSEIIDISKNCGANIIHRPAELSLDHVSTGPVITHAVKYLNKQKIYPTEICLLQPTSPLRNHVHIDKAFRVYDSSDADCVLSVFEPKYCATKMFKLNENGTISGLLFDDAPFYNRQDLPQAFQPNGAIYIFSTSAFLKNNQIPRHNIFPYIMSEWESVDVDTIEDFMKAKERLQ